MLGRVSGESRTKVEVDYRVYLSRGYPSRYPGLRHCREGWVGAARAARHGGTWSPERGWGRGKGDIAGGIIDAVATLAVMDRWRVSHRRPRLFAAFASLVPSKVGILPRNRYLPLVRPCRSEGRGRCVFFFFFLAGAVPQA